MSGYPNYQHGYGHHPQPKINGLAIASLILGIASLLLSCLTGLVGLILGFLAIVQIQSSNGRSTGTGMAITGIVLSIFLSMVMPLFLIIPAFATGIAAATGQAVSAANQAETQTKLRKIVLAMHDYSALHKELPNDLYLNGKPALSWRVMILPHLDGGKQVFDQFNLDQPWDSIQNLEAMRQMPEIFRSSGLGVGSDETAFKRPVGNGALFDGIETEKVTLGNIKDGTSKTIICVEVLASEARIWSKPGDFQYQPSDPLTGLNVDQSNQTFNAAFADGTVLRVDVSAGPNSVNRLFTKAGGE